MVRENDRDRVGCPFGAFVSVEEGAKITSTFMPTAGVGWVPFMFWRFDREYHFGGPETRVFKPDIPLSRSPTETVKKHLFFTFEVEEEGGFRRVPEVGFENFLWASDFPGLDSPWPHSKSEGHAPVEAALGKQALDRLVFENAVRLYKIPFAKPM